MSVRIPTQRIGQTALSTASRPTAPWHALPTTQSRSFSLNLFKEKKDRKDLENPLMAKYLQEQQEKNAAGPKKISPPAALKLKISDKTSIYQPGAELPGFREGLPKEELLRMKEQEKERVARIEKERSARLSAATLDPDPRSRILWERDMVIKSIQRRGRLTKEDELLKTERHSLFKSINLATTPKKMTKLMNQIAGKTVEEALVQMRFSKKRIARDIVKGLQQARDEAIAGRGMGLGNITVPRKIKIKLVRGEGETTEEFSARRRAAKEAAKEAAEKLLEERMLGPGTFRTPKTEPAARIELKDGRRIDVHNPTDIYIDQAWMGKGDVTKSLEFRARGMTNVLRHRTASFSVLLKEEKTRMRLSDEIKKKRDNRKLWTALPDRPITTQRQYCLW